MRGKAPASWRLCRCQDRQPRGLYRARRKELLRAPHDTAPAPRSYKKEKLTAAAGAKEILFRETSLTKNPRKPGIFCFPPHEIPAGYAAGLAGLPPRFGLTKIKVARRMKII